MAGLNYLDRSSLVQSSSVPGAGVSTASWCKRADLPMKAEIYKSLSEIAFAITGTKWNGPRFFGLRRSSNEETEDLHAG